MKGFPTSQKGLIDLLERLGFKVDVSSGRGGHYKYIHPTRKPVVQNQPPFIMMQRHECETGYPEIIKQELVAFGFTKEELKSCL